LLETCVKLYVKNYHITRYGVYKPYIWMFVRHIRPYGYLDEAKLDFRILNHLNCLALKPEYKDRDDEFELALVEAFGRNSR
jgi:hypothetical protein